MEVGKVSIRAFFVGGPEWVPILEWEYFLGLWIQSLTTIVTDP